MKLIKTQPLIKFLLLLLLFFFLLTVWIFYHELSHFYACEFLGYKATITFERARAETSCPGIENSSLISKLLYIMMPYIVDLSVFLPIFYLLYVKNLPVKESLVRLLPYVVATDACYNYFSSLHTASDFLKAFLLLKSYWFVSAIIPTILAALTALLARKDLASILKRKILRLLLLGAEYI